jgi:hypothetical protein
MIAARARGLTTEVLTADLLAAIELARDPPGLASALEKARLPADPAPDAVDALTRARTSRDLAILARWSGALAPLELDEDRRSLRLVIRGLAAAAPAGRRLLGTIATASLPSPVLAALAAAPDLAGITDVLARRGHPFAAVLADQPLDTLALELALARRFAELARPRDHAMRIHVTQVIDAENVEAALLIAARGAGVPDAFVRGGRELGRDAFEAAVRQPIDAARETLAAALATTPLADALYAPAPGALEDAALGWQLATQRGLRRLQPLGLAPAIHLVLRRRDEARRLRRAAWKLALGDGT